jgi:hypothetical protein
LVTAASSGSNVSLRQLTIVGEEAMILAEEEARALLDGYSNAIVRSYAAAGLLTAALDELTADVPRAVAIEALKQALLTLDALPS